MSAERGVETEWTPGPKETDGFFDGTDSVEDTGWRGAPLFTINHAAESTPNDPERLTWRREGGTVFPRQSRSRPASVRI